MELEEGYKQLSEYVNDKTKLLLECPEGHEFEITPNNWKKGRRCKECFKDRQRVRMNKYWSNTAETVVKSVNKSIDCKPIILSKKEYNKKEWGEFMRYIEPHSLFKFVGIGRSKGILKMELIHNTSGSSLEVWVLQSIKDNIKLQEGVVPIYLEDSDITTDLNYLKDWMKETHRNY